MITKISNVYVPYHTRTKYKSITVYIKNKKRLGAYATLSKGNPKNKQRTKTNKEGLDKRKKLFKLCNRNKICFQFPCLFNFHR